MVRMPIRTFAVSAALALAMVLITVPLGGAAQASSPMDSWMTMDGGGSAWLQSDELPNPFVRDFGDRCQWWKYELNGRSYERTYCLCRYGDGEISYRKNVRAAFQLPTNGVGSHDEPVSTTEAPAVEAEVTTVDAATVEAAAEDATAAEAVSAEATTEEGFPKEAAAADIVDTAAAAMDFAAMLAAAGATDLADTLRGEGPYTIFMPYDAAFAALPEGTLDELLADPSGQLTQVVLYHVVSGKVMSGDMVDGMEVETLQGGTILITIVGDAVTIGGANLLYPDIVTTNGVIHVIDAVLQPPAE